MRAELRDLQKRLGITAIYVTHDQEEALNLSDRIAIMRAGEIVDIDTPASLYFTPKTLFTAQFIGRAEILPCTRRDATTIDTPIGPLRTEQPAANGTLVIRPEHIEIDPTQPGNIVHGVIERVSFAGRIIEYDISVGATHLRVQRTSETLHASQTTVTLRLPPNRCTIIV
jgi:ABC-type Fe3+/spermidine/putrescine transport system ATPase subunit